MQIGGYVPGSIGRIVEMHGRYCARHWRFGAFFEAKVAQELGELLARFMLTDQQRDRTRGEEVVEQRFELQLQQ